MFQSVRQRRRGDAPIAVDIAPLIDVVFILLIFFLVTATFVNDTGIEVERPQAAASEALDPASMRVSIAASGAVYTEGERVEMGALGERVRGFVAENPEGSVIVIPDARAASGRLVAVMDAAKGAGAKEIAVATREGP